MKQKQAEKEKMEEALQKKKEAEKYFESWKREKDGKIKVSILNSLSSCRGVSFF